jgi:hypothetical protein
MRYLQPHNIDNTVNNISAKHQDAQAAGSSGHIADGAEQHAIEKM